MSIGQRANYSDFFTSAALPVMEEVVMQAKELHQPVLERLFQIKKTSRDIYQASEMHGLPLFSQMSELEQYSYNSQKQGANKTFTPVKWGLGVGFSQEQVDDGKFDFIADALRRIPDSAQETREINYADIFNTGFDTELSADGQYVFDTDHSLPSGATYRNELNTASDLSPSSLEQMEIDFKKQFVSDNGSIQRIMPKFLLVPTELGNYARELVGSSKKPDSSDNNLNSLPRLMVVESPHLTDSDAWFMLSDPSKHGLRIVRRSGLETKGGEDFDNDSLKYKARFREDIGVMQAQGIFGSPGAA